MHDERTSTQFQLSRFIFLYSGDRHLKLSPSRCLASGAGAMSDATTTMDMDSTRSIPEK